MHEKTRTKKDDNDAPSDSNPDPYLTDWWPKGGRDVLITLGERYDWDVWLGCFYAEEWQERARLKY